MSALFVALWLTAYPSALHGVAPQRQRDAMEVFTRAFTAPSALTQAVDALVNWYAHQGLPMAHVWKIQRQGSQVTLYVSEGIIQAVQWEGVSDDAARWLERQIEVPLISTPFDEVRLAQIIQQLARIPWIAQIKTRPEVHQSTNTPAKITLVFEVVPKPPAFGANFVLDTRGAGTAADLTLPGFPSPWASLSVRPELRLWRISLAPNDDAPAYRIFVAESLGKPTSITPLRILGVYLTSEVERGWNLPWRETATRFDHTRVFLGPAFEVPKAKLAIGLKSEGVTKVRQVAAFPCTRVVCPTHQRRTQDMAATLHFGDRVPNQAEIVGGVPQRNIARVTMRAAHGTVEHYAQIEGAWTHHWELFPGHGMALHVQGGGLLGQAQFYRRFALGGMDTLAAFPEQYRFGNRYAQYATRIEPGTGSQAVHVWAGVEGGTTWEQDQLNPLLFQTSAGTSIDLILLRAWLQLATPLRGQGGRTALVFRVIVEQ